MSDDKLEFTKENFARLAQQVIDLEAALDAAKKENLNTEVDKQKLLWGMEQAKATASHIGLETAEEIISTANEYVKYIDDGLMQAASNRSVKQ